MTWRLVLANIDVMLLFMIMTMTYVLNPCTCVNINLKIPHRISPVCVIKVNEIFRHAQTAPILIAENLASQSRSRTRKTPLRSYVLVHIHPLWGTYVSPTMCIEYNFSDSYRFLGLGDLSSRGLITCVSPSTLLTSMIAGVPDVLLIRMV